MIIKCKITKNSLVNHNKYFFLLNNTQPNLLGQKKQEKFILLILAIPINCSNFAADLVRKGSDKIWQMPYALRRNRLKSNQCTQL